MAGLRNRLHFLYLRVIGALASLAGHQPMWKFSVAGQLSGLKMAHVIDVGVAHGTDFLEAAFPTASFYLFEPNPSFYAELDAKIATKKNWQLFRQAAGAASDQMELTQSNLSSSLLSKDKSLPTITVPVEPLDKALAGISFNGGLLLKIDTEGYELDVLKGATQLLEQATAVILELRLMGVETYRPHEVIDFLHQRGLFFTRVLHAGYRPHGINYIDVLFTRATAE